MKDYTDLVTSAAPTAAARVRLRPVDARGVAIRDGLLADRQRVNREVTLLRGAEELAWERGRPGTRRISEQPVNLCAKHLRRRSLAGPDPVNPNRRAATADRFL